jgi:hypothetical protein
MDTAWKKISGIVDTVTGSHDSALSLELRSNRFSNITCKFGGTLYCLSFADILPPPFFFRGHPKHVACLSPFPFHAKICHRVLR